MLKGYYISDTLVHTDNGLEKISEVIKGDKVITADGHFNKVTNVTHVDVEIPLMKIEYLYGSNDMYPIIGALDNKILINREGQNDWIRAEEINPTTDFVCVPKVKPLEECKRTYDLNDYNYDGYYFDDEYVYEEYKDIKGRKIVKRIKRFITRDEDLNIFFGLMYAVGVTRANGISLKIENNIYDGGFEKYILMRIASKLGITISPSSIFEDNIQLNIESKILRRFVQMELDLINGFNLDLLEQSRINLLGLCKGLTGNMKCNMNKNDEICFEDLSNSVANALKILYLITDLGLTEFEYKDKDSFILKEVESNNWLVHQDKNYYYLPIKRISILPKQMHKLYALDIENSHNYLLNNMIVHD